MTVIPKTKKLTGILSAKANDGIENAIFNTINKSCNCASIGIIPNIIDIHILSVQKSIIFNTVIAFAITKGFRANCPTAFVRTLAVRVPMRSAYALCYVPTIFWNAQALNAL